MKTKIHWQQIVIISDHYANWILLTYSFERNGNKKKKKREEEKRHRGHNTMVMKEKRILFFCNRTQSQRKTIRTDKRGRYRQQPNDSICVAHPLRWTVIEKWKAKKNRKNVISLCASGICSVAPNYYLCNSFLEIESFSLFLCLSPLPPLSISFHGNHHSWHTHTHWDCPSGRMALVSALLFLSVASHS